MIKVEGKEVFGVKGIDGEGKGDEAEEIGGKELLRGMKGATAGG